jgi:hypothetical protein
LPKPFQVPKNIREYNLGYMASKFWKSKNPNKHQDTEISMEDEKEDDMMGKSGMNYSLKLLPKGDSAIDDDENLREDSDDHQTER